jgi:hypothetical protein
MKRAFVVASLSMLFAAPAAAQLMGLPVWNSPKGGTGITINGDYSMPDDAAGGGTAFGGRATFGFANLTIMAGVSSWDSDLTLDPVTSFGGTVAFRVIGGSLMPVSVNLIAGGAKQSGGLEGTTALAGAGVSAALPIPGFGVEPYVSVANQWFIPSGGDTDANLGVTFGANLTMGILGLHLAYETASVDGSSRGVFGIGAHVAIKAPI